MNIFDRHSIAPAGDRAVTAVLLKLFLCQYVPRGLKSSKVDCVDKGLTRPQVMQMAFRFSRYHCSL